MTGQTTDYPATRIAEGFSFLESPRWHEGDLFVSDFYTHRVLRFPGGSGDPQLVCEVPQRPSGLAWTPSGDLLIVSMLDRSLLKWDGASLIRFADLSHLVSGPVNDMVGARDGRVWAGNFGDDLGPSDAIAGTSIVTVGPNGDASIAAHDLNFPNGMVLSDDQTTLLVAETFAARITAFDVNEDGSLTGRRTWADLGGGDIWSTDRASAVQPMLPDGIALDADGALWVADAKGSGAVRMTEGGEITGRVDTGDLSVYAVALGGPNGRDLFMCCSAPFGREDPATTRHSALLTAAIDAPAAGAAL